jgi:uncharacterized membrane protein YhaH (DUF805 family)
MTPQLFSFKGQIRPFPYALASAAIFFSQHLVALLALKAQGTAPNLDWLFYVMPLRVLVTRVQLSDAVLIAAFAYGLIVAWSLAVLAFRRAANANISEWVAAAAIVPVIQIPVIVSLCVLPPRVAVAGPAVTDDAGATPVGWAPAAQGVIAGTGLTLCAVAVSTLGFGVYGYGLFIVSPFVIGAITAYFANRKHDAGAAQTARLVAGAAMLGGLALVATALEGILCIVLASPIGLGAALIGGFLGRAIAVSTKRPAGQAVSSFALLPIVFALESALPATTTFDTSQIIEVDAPPTAVWKAIVTMDTMDEPLALPFRLGVAYPLRGEIVGEGVGAVRRGEFSTGTAIERVTEWIANRKLAFIVVTDVPAMREISPYAHVHAPHAVGYFRTGTTSFELLARPGDRTEIIERTSHELKLDPVFYWLPMARWIVHENNARVLAHIKRQSERSPR